MITEEDSIMDFIKPINPGLAPRLASKLNCFKNSPVRIQMLTHPHISDIHWHDYTQIWYTISGTYVHTINGEQRLQMPGSLAIVTPYAIHSMDTTMTDFENAKIVYISIANDSLNEAELPYLPLTYNLSAFDDFQINPFVSLSGKNKERADELCTELLSPVNSGILLPLKKVLSNIGELFELCAKEIGIKLDKADLTIAKERSICIKNSIDYIMTSSASKVSLTKASKQAMMSERSFTSKFKQTIGQTAHNYLTNVRISNAFELLRYTDMSIKDISGLCGFANSGHFIRLSMKLLDASPSDIRSYVRKWDVEYLDEMKNRHQLAALLNSFKRDDDADM